MLFYSGGSKLQQSRIDSLIQTGSPVAASCSILACTDTGSTPEMAQTIHERIADSRLVILPRYRHSLLIEATAEVVSELRAFFGSLNNPQPS